MPDETQAPSSTLAPLSSPSTAPVAKSEPPPEDDVEHLEAAGFRKVHGAWRR